MTRTRGELLFDGELHIRRWCDLNQLAAPTLQIYKGAETDFGTCAYYRDDVIHIWPDACARVGASPRKWSWPGYVVDRTPYGVLAHELGHYVDRAHGARGGFVASAWKTETGEAAITSYCPNDNEWFAEIFRLFVTNPDLLLQLRPLTYKRLITRWPGRAEQRDWREVLLAAPQRWIDAANNKILKVRR